MTKFKGTRGKWKTIGLEVWKAEGNPLIIGKAHQHNLNNMGLQEQKANAILISKAPELLEMLQEFCNMNPSHPIKLAGLMDKAEQLIKEATEL